MTKKHILFFRADARLKDQIAKYKKKVRRETGLDVAFSVAVRGLVESALRSAGVVDD